jgi:hypothetical protein
MPGGHGRTCGSWIKRQRIVDPAEADTVRLIVQFNRHGDGRAGPIGVKPIGCYGNEGGVIACAPPLA